MRLVRRVLIATLVGALLVELLLQVGAFVVWSSSSRTEERDESAQRILCVGDSFTFGIGASDHRTTSYPEQLEQELTERGHEVQVFNRGWAGQNSRDVLEKLADDLVRTRPTAVCILVGANDLWSTPKPIPNDHEALDLLQAQDHASEPVVDAFPWRFRLARLVMWAFQDEANGEGTFLSTEPVPETSAEPTATPRPAIEVDGATARERGMAHIRHQQWAQAIAELTEHLQTNPGDAHAHTAKLRAHVHQFENEAAAAELAIVERLHAEQQTRATAEAWLQALKHRREFDRTIEIAPALAESFPESTWVLWAWGSALFENRELDRAAEILRRALASIDRTAEVAWWTGMARMIAESVAAADPDEAARLIVEALRTDRIIEKAVLCIRDCSPHVTQARVEAVAEVATLSAEDRKLVDDTIAACFGSPMSPIGQILALHLARCVELCAEAGAQPVIVTYPKPNGIIAAGQKLIGTAQGVHYAPTHVRFAELPSDELPALFVPDGHCNDDGYAIMAKAVADVVAELL